jgi:hypothetical protein
MADSITLLNVLRDTLRTYLTDPYTYTVPANQARDGTYWIFGDEPANSAKYPMIQILKLTNPTVPISIGPVYWEHEQVFANIWFYSKNGFSITVNGTTYKNAQVVEYYLGKIKTTLKSKFLDMCDDGARDYKAMDTTPVGYNSETQLYFGAVTVRVRTFHT